MEEHHDKPSIFNYFIVANAAVSLVFGILTLVMEDLTDLDLILITFFAILDLSAMICSFLILIIPYLIFRLIRQTNIASKIIGMLPLLYRLLIYSSYIFLTTITIIYICKYNEDENLFNRIPDFELAFLTYQNLISILILGDILWRIITHKTKSSYLEEIESEIEVNHFDDNKVQQIKKDVENARHNFQGLKE